MRLQTSLADLMLSRLAYRYDSNRIHSPSCHSRPQRMQVLAQPYQGVKNSSMRVLFLQSGQTQATARLAVDLGA